MQPDDAATIAAIATPPGLGAVAVVRLSGPRAWELLAALVGGATLPRPRHAAVRTLHYNGAVLDQALVLGFRAPASFTGEDVVEVHCHGGVQTPQRVLDALVAVGARLAEPGEFTRRALLNGKLDMLQAEAIADVIHAQEAGAQQLAQHQLAGRLSARVQRLVEAVVSLCVLVEAAIDFSLEEHVYSVTADEICAALDPVIADLEHLLGTWRDGQLRVEGVRVALVGEPNAGKSSLLNHLLQRDRALVTDVPGTTRDWIEESVVLGDLHIRLVDTAGLRDTEDRVEAMGVAQSRAWVQRADAILLVVDATAATTPQALLGENWEVASEQNANGAPPRPPVGVVWNKIDLVPTDPPPGWLQRYPHATVSLRSGAGTDALPGLVRTLARAAGLQESPHHEGLTRARHREAIADACDALQRAHEAAGAGLPHEMVAMDLRAGLDALSSMTSAVTSEDILHRIFTGFCIGK